MINTPHCYPLLLREVSLLPRDRRNSLLWPSSACLVAVELGGTGRLAVAGAVLTLFIDADVEFVSAGSCEEPRDLASLMSAAAGGSERFTLTVSPSSLLFYS